jgi:mono/diheme cytochrome c family protein
MKKMIPVFIIAAALTFAASTVRAADSAALWTANCAACHGKDGSGSTMMGKKLGIKDYRDAKVQTDMTDDAMTKAIKDGVSANGKQEMKSFKDKLSDDEIKSLVAYVRSFKK